jgi:hypothetical protein
MTDRQHARTLVGIITTSADFGEQLTTLVRREGGESCVWPLDTQVVATVLAAQPDLVILQVPASLPLLERWRRTVDIGSVPVIPCSGVEDRLWSACLEAIRNADIIQP